METADRLCGSDVALESRDERNSGHEGDPHNICLANPETQKSDLGSGRQTTGEVKKTTTHETGEDVMPTKSAIVA